MEKYESYNENDLEEFYKTYGGLELEQYYNETEETNSKEER